MPEMSAVIETYWS